MFLKFTKLIQLSFLSLLLGVSLIGCGSNSDDFQLAADTSETDSKSDNGDKNAKQTGPVIKDTVNLPRGRKIGK